MKVCCILLSYKRPQNMQRIVNQVLKVERIERVILSNNNPDIDIRDWVTEHERVELINQPVRMHCAKRFEIADSLDYPYFFCPDDDLFFARVQIEFLLDQLQKNPEVPHGMYGELISFVNGAASLSGGVHRVTCEVDVLNRAYFFTKAHVSRLLELSRALGWQDVNEAVYMDDVLLSFSGNGRPVCHNIGRFEDCPTSSHAEIATYMQDGFTDIRIRDYRRLAEITGRSI